MNKITLASIAQFEGVTDVTLNTRNLSMSPIFPAQKITQAMSEVLEALVDAIREKEDEDKSKPAYEGSDGCCMIELFANDAAEDDAGAVIRFRVQSHGCGVIYAVRKTAIRPPNFDDIVSSQEVRDVLTNIELKKSGGLILIIGSTGSGKSTLAYASIIKRLEMHGGHCLSIEDPPEITSVFGYHGDKGGSFSQMDASKMGYAKAIKQGFRSYPRVEGVPLMFIGEVRDEEAATEMLRASLGGALLIATVHAPTAPEAIQRILALSEKGEPYAKSILASTLKYIVVQDSTLSNRITSKVVTISKSIKSSIESGNMPEVLSAIKTQENAKREMAMQNNAQQSMNP